jgi:riboflavin kinase/FMN adenylyltransferase
MIHLRELAAAHVEKPSIVAIGVFDGVHRGHQLLIQRLVENARASDRTAVVITFFPHPDVLLRGLSGRYYLTSPDEKAELLTELGVDVVITLPFDDRLRHVRAAEFVDKLVGQLKLSSLWVGEDFALGYKREGNVPFLREQGVVKEFDVHTVDLLMGDHAAISSTRIRESLLAGDVESANTWLGRGYRVQGEVVHGQKRGRTIGFPTANIAVWEELVIPANGIYAGWAEFDDQRYMAATSVGTRPTFNNGQDVTVEAYLLDFDGDLYGKTLSFSFERYLRPELRYTDIPSLIEQISKDVADTREFLMAQEAQTLKE